MTLWISWAIGLVVGVIVTSIFWVLRSGHGILRIDRSNPEKDVYRFDVKDLDGLAKKKHVLLRVVKNADLSQK